MRNPLELFQKLVPYMSYWKLLSLTGPGESLLNPKLSKIFDLVRKNSDCTLLMTTNGVLINERLAELFVDYQVDEVSISLDSLTKKIFEELRVNGRFERVIHGIDMLNEEKKRRNSDRLRINLTPTFMRRNISELPSFMPFARRKMISEVKASPAQIYRRSWVDESLLHCPRSNP